MWEDLKKTVFKEDLKRIKKMKGEKKEDAMMKLMERIEMYDVARDFAAFYPKIYTKDVLQRIVDAKNNIEAENILISLRKRQGECTC